VRVCVWCVSIVERARRTWHVHGSCSTYMRMRVLTAFTLAAVVHSGHPGAGTHGKVEQHPEPERARHEATFTTFCDTGSVAGGDCWCKGGSATAAIGDGSWLWHELMGAPCAAQPNDRCDCTSCGGSHEACPHEGCWQCQGVNAPQCNPTDELKRCEVEVHGTHGAEKYYITEVCPSAHPCNRCKETQLQRCAAWSPLAIDVCGTTWQNVFDVSRSEARGYVTLSCYPHEYNGGGSPQQKGQQLEAGGGAGSEGATGAECYSEMPDDTKQPACEDWCSAEYASEHCKWCKCRGDACRAQMGDACELVIRAIEAEAAERAAFFAGCGHSLDCKSWCNIGNCKQCPCAACERCGPVPDLGATRATDSKPESTVMASAPGPKRDIKPAASLAHPTVGLPLACHGWCETGVTEDPEVVCRSSKCTACPICQNYATLH